MKQPSLIIETGVFDGKSSALILQALFDNDHGFLVSIDLPATTIIHMSTNKMLSGMLPEGCQPGWLIPDYLRKRHQLLLGDSGELLPSVLEEHPHVDIFLHHSLHTFDHMYWEYKTVWPHLTKGGILLSDDIFWNRAFHVFCRERRRKYFCLKNFGGVIK
jgi:predicted O-methyltransferase YrrM